MAPTGVRLCEACPCTREETPETASGGEERVAPWDLGLSGSDPRDAWARTIVLRMRAAHINRTIREHGAEGAPLLTSYR